MGIELEKAPIGARRNFNLKVGKRESKTNEFIEIRCTES